MRRNLITAATSLLVLLATAAPALATTREEAGTRGTFGGVALALVLGAIFAGVIVALAYRDTDFGDEEAHAEEPQEGPIERDESSGDQQLQDETQAQRP